MSLVIRWLKRDKGGKKMSNETRRIYYTAEFSSLGDVTKDGLVNFDEFQRLMMLLGYPGGRDGSQRIWKYAGKKAGDQMTQDEYITLMFDKKIDSKTNQWRKLFAEFDTDGSGWATKAEVMQGLEKIGLEDTPQLKQAVEQLDTNQDHRISYTDFLRGQLHQT